MLSQEHVRWLTDFDTLQSMAHLSLRERSQIIKEKFNLRSFGLTTLRHYYLRYGVKFKRPDYRYWKSQAENRDLKSQQLEFVQRLGTMIKEDSYTEIVYIDETTFHLWQKVPKCWLRPGMKLCM